jgi:hypothetical protein
MEILLCGSEVDRRLKWSIGHADRLARRGRLPHVRLPDDSLRFEWSVIERLLVRVGDVAVEPRGESEVSNA